jgi:streptomycin 6-kinase
MMLATLCVPKISSMALASRVALLPSGRDDHGHRRRWTPLGQNLSARLSAQPRCRTALPGSGRGTAFRYAAAHEAAFDPRRGVLVHGDARPFNLLQVPGHAAGFRLIDPEGVAAEPALELGVMCGT